MRLWCSDVEPFRFEFIDDGSTLYTEPHDSHDGREKVSLYVYVPGGGPARPATSKEVMATFARESVPTHPGESADCDAVRSSRSRRRG